MVSLLWIVFQITIQLLIQFYNFLLKTFSYIAYYTNMYKTSFEKKHNNDDCFWDIPSSSEEDKDSIIYENYVKVLKKIMEEGRTL